MNAVKVSGMRCDHCTDEATIRVDSDRTLRPPTTPRSTRSLWLCRSHAANIQRVLAMALHPAGSDA
jgi:hypothetical protein